MWEKTGSLIAASGRFGGTFSGAAADQVARLEELGSIVGTAFQISDDIIDISSASAQSGKTPAPTCARACTPCRRCTRCARRSRRPTGCGCCSTVPVTDDDDLAEALDLLERSQGMAAAKSRLAEYADRAEANWTRCRQAPPTRRCDVWSASPSNGWADRSEPGETAVIR